MKKKTKNKNHVSGSINHAAPKGKQTTGAE